MGHLWLQGLLGSWVSCLGREEAGTACREERCQGLQETLYRQGRGLSPTEQGSTRQSWACCWPALAGAARLQLNRGTISEPRTLDLEPLKVRASGERPAVLWDQTK